MSKERETRYADALRTSIRDYTGVPDMDEVWNFSLVKAAGVQAPAVMAVADAEHADLRAQVEQHKAALNVALSLAGVSRRDFDSEDIEALEGCRIVLDDPPCA